MTDNDESVVLARFALSAPRFSPKAMYALVFGGCAALVLAFAVAHMLGLSKDAAFGIGALIMVGYLGLVAYLTRSSTEVAINVTSSGVAIDGRPGDVYPFSGITLGPWTATMYGIPLGTTLHLRNGRRRFVVGGEHHRIPIGTRLEAPPTLVVDAQMPAAEFDDLLAMIGPAAGLEIRRASPVDPIRCLLVPNAARFFSTARFGVTPRPSMAIDIGPQAVWVIDLNSNAPLASAWTSQVTVTPAMHLARGKGDVDMPVIVVRVPGMEPLSLGCPDPRFSWPGPADRVDQPAYVISGADWITLVERCSRTL